MNDTVTLADGVTALLQGLGLGGGFFFIRWCAIFMSGRWDKKEAQLDAGTSQLLDRMKEEIRRVSDECVALRTRASATEDELHHCREQHAECEARVQRLEATFQGYGDAKQLAALQAAAQHQSAKEQDKDKD